MLGRPDTSSPIAIPEGCVLCICGATPSITARGRMRKHKTPQGDECTHRAGYAEVVLERLPPVVLPPNRVPSDRGPARLDVGSECRECGKWLPGERSLCGRCYAIKDASR